jgi:hypothetical protein
MIFRTRLLAALPVATLALLALWPAADRMWARRQAEARARAFLVTYDREGATAITSAVLLPPLLPESPLASWGSIGGCGAGGGSSSSPGGGVKWVGRSVTGGLLDVQCLATDTWSHGNAFSALTNRLGTRLTSRWGLAAYVPVLYKTGDVSVLGQSKTARIAGFGDVSLEISRKLGVTGAHQLMLIGTAPTGASDAVRQGIVLPQYLQLGSGVPGATAMYQYTRDRDWGLLLLGATATYAGWENSIHDYRAPNATAFAHVGYLLGPFVPSAGLTMFGKPMHDRERGADRPASSDPLVMAVPGVGLEWSSDYVAFLLGGTLGLSLDGVQSYTLGLGVTSSVF